MSCAAAWMWPFRSLPVPIVHVALSSAWIISVGRILRSSIVD